MKIDLERVKNYAGLGDLVMWAWLVEGSRLGADPITIYRKRDAALTEMLGLTIDAEPGGLNIDPVYELEIKERCRVPRVDYIRQHLKLSTPLVRPTLRIPWQDEEWADQTVRELDRPLVLLFPQVAWKPREWPAPYWIDLAWRLKARRLSVVMVLAAEDPRYKATPLFWWNYPLPRIAAIMKRAALVVGNDSFPAHLAGTLGVPTLALMGPTRPLSFAHVPEVQCLATSRLPCVGCHFQEPFRAACDQGCAALFQLLPDDVLRCICDKMQRRAPGWT
jgi:hypothetical protein